MGEYIRSHWRGEQSLAQSYWINAFLLSIIAKLLVAFYNQPNELDKLSINKLVALDILVNVFLWIILIWSLVGVWRSATNHELQTRKRFWSNVAKVMVILGFLSSAGTTAMLAQDYRKMYDALEDPDMTDFILQKYGANELYFAGAINDESVDRVLNALKEAKGSDEPLLRVNSSGGFVRPALRLAEFINDENITVMAETQCHSSCVTLMAASPYTILATGTSVLFHQTEALTEFSTPELEDQSRAEMINLDREVNEALSRYLLADWAIRKTKTMDVWAPSVSEMLEMQLIVSIWDTNQAQLYDGVKYCLENSEYCQNGNTN